jgi:hypothetical protein
MQDRSCDLTSFRMKFSMNSALSARKSSIASGEAR